MNYDEMKKQGVNKVEISDSLKAPLLKLNIRLNENTTNVEDNKLIINIDDSPTDISNREQVVFNLSKPLYQFGTESDEFILEPSFKGNKVSMSAYVKRRISTSLLETPITEGMNLSGKTLELNFPDILGTYSNYYPGLISSEKYTIREEYDAGVNLVVLKNKETNTTIEELYVHNPGFLIAQSLESIKLPDDFGIVTNVIASDSPFAIPMNYIKYYKTTETGVLDETIENLSYQPIIVNEGLSYISTNYNNAIIDFVYPKNIDLVKYFFVNSFTYGLNNEDKFLTLDDIYFKDCFTEIEDGFINAEFNKVTMNCMNSTNNNFSLDCDGNLVVNTITTKVTEPTPENTTLNNLTVKSLNANNNKFSLDNNGNLSVNSISTTVPISSNFNLLSVYPVGSIYMSVNNTNPSSLFGGTWTQITGRFLYATTNSKQTGGASSKTVNHNHQYGIQYNAFWGALYAQDSKLIRTYNGSAGTWEETPSSGQSSSATGNDGIHEYTGSTFSTAINQKIQNTTSSSITIDTMPPYFTVYCWYRTA